MHLNFKCYKVFSELFIDNEMPFSKGEAYSIDKILGKAQRKMMI